MSVDKLAAPDERPPRFLFSSSDLRFPVPDGEVWMVPTLGQRPDETHREFVSRVAAAIVRIVNVTVDGPASKD
jgi:hypothetical protein